MNHNIKSIEEQIVKLRLDGASYRDIVNELQVTIHTVRKVIRSNNLNEMTYKNVCPNCKEEYETNLRLKVYCSSYCKRRGHEDTTGQMWVCGHCNKEYRAYTEKHRCSLECGMEETEKKNLIRRLVYVMSLRKQCECCGNTFDVSSRWQKYCSRKCNQATKEEKKRIYYNHKCRECGKHYTNTRKSSGGCSITCSNRYSNRIGSLIREERIKANGSIDLDISVERLVKRDKGICYLCDEKVDVNDYYYDDNGYYITGVKHPSIDHVQPISKGGTHTWNNVKLTHMSCNSRKGNKEEEELSPLSI